MPTKCASEGKLEVMVVDTQTSVELRLSRGPKHINFGGPHTFSTSYLRIGNWTSLTEEDPLHTVAGFSAYGRELRGLYVRAYYAE